MISVNGREVKFEKFPNGETRMITDSIKNDWYYIVDFKYEDDSDLIKLMFVKKYVDNMKTGELVRRISLTIFYMPYSRMDRSEEGSPFTLKYVTEFINGLNFDYVTVVEPHSDVTTALLDNVEAQFINFRLLPKVMKEVNFDVDNDYIMFPDLGASRRYKSLDTQNILIGHKVRDFKTGQINSLDLIGEVPLAKDGRKVIIVDDLSSYGGTFVHSAKKLREEGFEEIYLLVAHAENSIFKGELFNHIDKLFTTDSILTEQNNWENKKFEKQLKIYKIFEVL